MNLNNDLSKFYLGEKTTQLFVKVDSKILEHELLEALKGMKVKVKDLNQEFDYLCNTVGGENINKLTRISEPNYIWSSILLHHNSKLGEDLALRLSRVLDFPILTIFEFGHFAWGFKIYNKSKMVNGFCSNPSVVNQKTDLSCNFEKLAKDFELKTVINKPTIYSFQAMEITKELVDEMNNERIGFLSSLKIDSGDLKKWLYLKEKDVNY